YRPGTVEVGYLAASSAGELLMDHCAKGCHADAPAYEDHLAVGRLDVELPIGTRDVDAVARLQPEKIGRDNARRYLRFAPSRRNCEADIVNQAPSILRSAGKRVGA